MSGTTDTIELEKFEKIADEWWDESGKFRPLHKFNPVRLTYIRDILCDHYSRDSTSPRPLSDLDILDIGCGGGLLSEPMSRLGGSVTGADASSVNIEVAKIHAEQSGLDIAYLATTAEELLERGKDYDVILNMEVIEHVSDIDLFFDSCCSLLRPGGLMFVGTINRTFKAKLLAIFLAENILGWLPRGTHQYEKLVTPSEIESAVSRNGVDILHRTGIFFNPLLDEWRLSSDMDVNYIMVIRRPPL